MLNHFAHQATVAKFPVSCLPLDGGIPGTDMTGAAGGIAAFEPGTAVYWQGDPSGSFYEVVEGMLRLYRITPDGRRAITGFAHPGDLVGLASRASHGETAEAVTCTTVRRHSRAVLLDHSSRSPALSQRLLGMFSDELSAAHDRILMLSRMDATEKIAWFLIETARRTGAKRNVHLSVSRMDIADYLGLTIETVSRTMSRLKQAGLIALPTPQMIVLLQRDELARIVEKRQPGPSAAENACAA